MIKSQKPILPPNSMPQSNRPSTEKLLKGSQSMSSFTAGSTLPELNNSSSLVSQRHKTLQKLLSKFPPDIRENVSSTLHLTLHENEQTKQQLNVLNVENSALKSELRSKQQEVQNLFQLSNRLKMQVSELEEASYNLKDKLEFRTKFMMVNKKSSNKITNVNKMLMDCLEALQERPVVGQNKVLTFAAFESQELAIQGQGATDDANDATKAMSQTKLKDSLMRATSELAQFTRKNQLLEEKVQELSASLKKFKQENVNLQTEVHAMRSLGFSDTKADGQHNDTNNNTTPSNEKYIIKKKSFDMLDQKLQVLLTRQNISKEDTLLMLRRIVGHLSSAPFISSIPEAAKMVTSKAVLQIFDVEVITFFVTPFIEIPFSELYHKYSSETSDVASSNVPFETYHVDDFSCVAFKVVKSNKMIKLNTFNDITSSVYNPTIDCHNNIAVRTSLSFPIFDIHTSKVIGVVQMFNKKSTLGKGFTEFDEIFGSIFCNCLAFILNACSKAARTTEQANILTKVLSGSTEIFNSIKEKVDFASNKIEPLSPTDMLHTLETVIEKLMKCGRVKAFIPSEKLDMEPGLLMYLEEKKSNRLAHGSYMKAMRNDAGLIGECLRTKTVRIIDGIETDARIHTEVDMDPFGQSLVSVPILGIDGEVLALFQLTLSKNNYNLFVLSPEDPDSSVKTITQYLAHQLSFAFSHLLQLRRRQLMNTNDDMSLRGGGNTVRSKIDEHFDPIEDALFKANDKLDSPISMSDGHTRQAIDSDNVVKLAALLAKRETNDRNCFSFLSQQMNKSKTMLHELKRLPEYNVQIVQQLVDELEMKIEASLNKVWEADKMLSDVDYKNSMAASFSAVTAEPSRSASIMKSVQPLGLRAQEEEALLKKNTELKEYSLNLSKQLAEKEDAIQKLREQLFKMVDLSSPHGHGAVNEFSSAAHNHDFITNGENHHDLNEMSRMSGMTNQTHTWLEQKDDQGRTFFYNVATGVSLWEKPARSSIAKPSQPLELIRVGDWLQQNDADGHAYWLNVMTGVSEWTIPAPNQVYDHSPEHEAMYDEIVTKTVLPPPTAEGIAANSITKNSVMDMVLGDGSLIGAGASIESTISSFGAYQFKV